MKKIISGMTLLTLVGCATHPIYNITSSTPAYIEIDGVIKCKTTPCTITPPHYIRGFGECADGSSLQSILVAFPIDKAKGFFQQKTIRAKCNDNESVYFDMGITSGIQTIPITKE